MMKFLPHLTGFPQWFAFILYVLSVMIAIKDDGKVEVPPEGYRGKYLVAAAIFLGTLWMGGFWSTSGFAQVVMGGWCAYKLWVNVLNTPQDYVADKNKTLIICLGEAILLKVGGFW